MVIGAGDGNRTHVIGLGSRRSAIELHPHITFKKYHNQYLLSSKPRLNIV